MTKNDFELILRKAGYKITKPRLFVLSFLSNSKSPLPAKAISEEAKKRVIDQATIYRIIEAFKKSGIITEVNFQENRAYFELKESGDDHHHIICVKCKKIEDFIGCTFKQLVSNIKKQKSDFAEITNHSFELFGVCKSCA